MFGLILTSLNGNIVCAVFSGIFLAFNFYTIPKISKNFGIIKECVKDEDTSKFIIFILVTFLIFGATIFTCANIYAILSIYVNIINKNINILALTGLTLIFWIARIIEIRDVE